MNVLLFVTAMIMVLSMLTYTRLETYRNFSLLQSEFTQFMEKTERGYINKTAVWWYDNSKGEKRTPGKGQTKNEARSRLSFLVFIDKTAQAKYAQAYPKIVLLSKKLITYLYQNQPTFKKMLQQRPDILDALLARLMVADSLPKEQKIKKASDLANLELNDPLLDAFFYYILKGAELPEKKVSENMSQSKLPMPEFIIKEAKGEIDDEDGDQNIQQEYISPEGYFSLQDYITVDAAIKIRVYLASRALLMAIFNDPVIVDSIIAMRNDLYKKVVNGPMSPADAEAQFKTTFASKSDPNFDDTILDYTVTKTNPKNYE